MFIVSLCIYKKLELKRYHVFLFTLAAFLSDGLGAFLMGKIYTALVAAVGGEGESNFSIYGAVFLMPVIVAVSAKIIKQPWRRILDMVAPGEMIARMLAKLGCLWSGCCWGFMWEHGIYNRSYKTEMFPSPLVEAIVMLIIIVIAFWYMYKSKKYKSGAVYPLMTLLYASTRFFLEFTRYYRPDQYRLFVLGMTPWQVCSIIAVVMSTVWLLAINNDWLGKAKAYIEQKKAEKAEEERKARAQAKRYGQKKKKKRKM